jgi:hypothetical protein
MAGEGTAQLNAGGAGGVAVVDASAAAASAAAALAGVARGAVGRGPVVRTRSAPPSNATSTDPSVSVR